MDTHLTTQGKIRLFGKQSNARLTFWLGVILGFLIALLSIAAYIGYLFIGGKFFIEQPELNTNINTSLLSQPVTNININSEINFEQDYIYGNENAGLTLVVFTDYECELCKIYHHNVIKFVADHHEQVRLIEKNFVLSQKHPQAIAAAKFAYCANKQDKFQSAADELYENQNNLSDDYYSALIEKLSLNADDFIECQGQEDAIRKIEEDYSLGLNLGVQGIPNTVIIYPDKTMKLIDGNVSVEFLNSLLKEYL